MSILVTYTCGHGTSDEALLTTTYYKHAYLVSMKPVVDAAMASHAGQPVDEQELTRKLDASKLEISLSDIKTGPLQELLSQKWGMVYDIPAAPQEVLQVNVDTHEFQDFDQPKVSWRIATAKWVTAEPPMQQELLNLFQNWTVQTVLNEEQKRLNNGMKFTRYATYTVALHFRGKSVKYKALCFLGTEGKDVKALFEDGFLQSSAFSFGSMDLFPTALLQSSLAHEYKPLQGWLRQHTVASQGCQTGAGEFCCTGNSCGIASADLENELAQPAGNRRRP